jgi:hypothetical protein
MLSTWSGAGCSRIFPQIETIRSKLARRNERGALMAVVTGELIRAMNYVEDMTTTLRRICIYIPNMSVEERKRLAEALRSAVTAINSAITDLEKAEK